MGFLNRSRVKSELRKAVVVTVMLRLILRPELFHYFQRFGCLGPPVREVAPERGRLFRLPAGSNPKNKSAARVKIERRNALGEIDRVVLGNQQHTRAKAQGSGRGSGDRQGDKGVGHQQIRIGDRLPGRSSGTHRRVHRNDRVLGQPQRFEPELLAAGGELPKVH